MTTGIQEQQIKTTKSVLERKNRNCFTFQVKRDSKVVQTVKMVEFFNILYIAFTIPMTLAFHVKMNATLILAEVISLLISFSFVLVKIRTPVVI